MKTLLIALCLILFSCRKDSLVQLQHTYETDDVHYYNGEILQPDSLHDDIRIVINAEFLNYAMGDPDLHQSWEDTYETLQECTTPY